MKIELLREFLLLSERLNFTRAAQMLHITQPVLSRHMKELEEHVGAPLFQRDTHRVSLTSAGHRLACEVRKILHQYDESMTAVRTFTGNSRRRLTIAFLGEAIRQPLVALVEDFRQQQKEVVVECRDCELEEVLALLDAGECDAGFLIRPNFMPQRAGFGALPFQTDPLCVAVNRQHPLAQHGTVSLRDAAQWPVIRVDPREFALSEMYSTRFLSARGIDFTVYKEFPNLKSCCFDLELNARAVLFMPRHRGYLLGENSVLLSLSEQDCWFSLELIWPLRNRNPCVDWFCQAFSQYQRARAAPA
ncbi:LysR family transcriptional regulator [Kosakonia sp. H02]|nr:LysR family transcriptional regulator [Kosakonia sp. H02]